jgi:hypothetical protein
MWGTMIPFTMDMTESRKGRILAAAVAVGDADASANENSISLVNNEHGELRVPRAKAMTYNQLNNNIIKKTNPDAVVDRE